MFLTLYGPLYCLLSDFLWIVFLFTGKLSRGYRFYDGSVCPNMYRTPHHKSTSPSQDAAFVSMDDSMLTHQYHPTAIFYMNMCSWCHICLGVWQMYDDMCPVLYYDTQQFCWPKNLLSSTYQSLPSLNHWSALPLWLCFLHKVTYLDSRV